MRYAIIINMDYENQPYQACRLIWDKIRESMIEAGFRHEGRIFTISAEEDEACDRARAAVDRAQSGLDLQDSDIYTFIREFFGVDFSATTNLLLPPMEAIMVEGG